MAVAAALARAVYMKALAAAEGISGKGLKREGIAKANLEAALVA